MFTQWQHVFRSLFLLVVLCSCAWGQGTVVPASSGMAGWGKERYLVVHDVKEGNPAPRAGIILTGPGCRYTPVAVDWSSVNGESSDLEAIGPVDGLGNQFVAAESSYYKGRYGRVFWLEASDNPTPRLRAVGMFQLPQLEQEIEGIATRRLAANRWLVLLGGRGTRDGAVPGRIYWGVLNRDTWKMDWPAEGLHGEEVQLPRRVGPHGRTLSDMYIDDKGVLWVSACVDPGDEGPFRSLIYQAGHIVPALRIPFVRPREASPVWWIEGVKVEALGPAPRPGYGHAYATDDEDLEGIWRAVPAEPTP